jgi:hypothetical protein
MSKLSVLLCSLALAVAAASGTGLWLQYSSSTAVDGDVETAPSPTPTPGVPWFVDVTRAAGIDFVHFDPATKIDYIMETMGSGVAWIDYDHDGWPDLFFVQDGPIHPQKHHGPLPTNKLYRNNGDGTFSDVTRQVGLDRAGFGFGCAVGDFDNDGYDDLVVTYYRSIVLYHNEPDGKGGRHFVDVTARAGLDDPHWATSCAWGDVDGDGLLDLYVCNYAEVDIEHYSPCYNRDAKKYFSCPPTSFLSTHHRLYKNLGDGRFADVSAAAGLTKVPLAQGLAVVILDLDDDGLPDIYVANDMKPAYLLHNQGNGRFVEKGELAGCAMQPNGRLIAGMGIAVGDFDGTGRPSLFVTNFQKEPNMLFLNKGKMLFQEWSYPSGLVAGGLRYLAFGTVAFDADLDGLLDMAIANGHVSRSAREVFGDPYKQEPRLFLGRGDARFNEIAAQAGAYFRETHVGRGLACADYNNDGKPDLVFSHNGEPPALLRNDTQTDNRWLRLELEGDGKKSNRNAIGARVEIEAGGDTLVRHLAGGGSYLSASERRMLVGIGTADRADRVTVRWPSGRVQSFGPLAANRGYLLKEGLAQAQPQHF